MSTFRIFASAKGCDLADSLLNGSEAGLLHLRALSRVIGRKIRVWDSAGKILGIFENSDENTFLSGLRTTRSEIKEVKSVLLEDDLNRDNFLMSRNNFFKPSDGKKTNYLDLQYQYFENRGSGHWIGKDCRDEFSDNNDCLFKAISQQCNEYNPKMLRILTAEAIRREDTIMEKIFPQFQGAGILLLGGAKYDGSSADHAKKILDASQGTVGYRHVAKAHPRGHASHPSATGDIDSVENYSRGSSRDFPKSAWMTRNEQDNAMHKLLLSQQVQNEIEKLNRGETRVVIKMAPEFEILVGLWADGVMFSGPWKAELVTILLQHHNGLQNQPDANVQVFTCYPIAPKGSERQTTNIPRDRLSKHKLTEDDSEDDSEEGIIKKTRSSFYHD